MDIPLAIAAAPLNTSDSLDMEVSNRVAQLLLPPPGRLILRSSTCLPLRHVVALTEYLNAGTRAELFQFGLAESTSCERNRAVLFHQEQRWNVIDAQVIAQLIAI